MDKSGRVRNYSFPTQPYCGVCICNAAATAIATAANKGVANYTFNCRRIRRSRKLQLLKSWYWLSALFPSCRKSFYATKWLSAFVIFISDVKDGDDFFLLRFSTIDLQSTN